MNGQIRRVKIAQAKAVQSEATQFEVKNILESEIDGSFEVNSPMIWSRQAGETPDNPPIDISKLKKMFLASQTGILDVDDELRNFDIRVTYCYDSNFMAILLPTEQFPSGGPSAAGVHVAFYELNETGCEFIDSLFYQCVPVGPELEYSGDGVWFMKVDTFIGDRFHRINFDGVTATRHVVDASLGDYQDSRMSRIPGTNRVILSRVDVSGNATLQFRSLIPDGATSAAFTGWETATVQFGGETISSHRFIAIRSSQLNMGNPLSCIILTTFYRLNAGRADIYPFRFSDAFAIVTPNPTPTLLNGLDTGQFIRIESDYDDEERGALITYNTLDSTATMGTRRVVRKVYETRVGEVNFLPFSDSVPMNNCYDQSTRTILIGGAGQRFYFGRFDDQDRLNLEGCSFNPRESAFVSEFDFGGGAFYDKRFECFRWFVTNVQTRDFGSGIASELYTIGNIGNFVGFSAEEGEDEEANIDLGPSVINYENPVSVNNLVSLGRTVYMNKEFEPTTNKDDAFMRLGRLVGPNSVFFLRE